VSTEPAKGAALDAGAGTTAEATPEAEGSDVPHRAVNAPGPATPLAWGLCAGVLFASALFLQQILLGRWPFGDSADAADAWVGVLHCLLAGYAPGAYLASLAVGRRAEREIGESLGVAVGSITEGLPPNDRPGQAWLVAGLVGAAFALLGPWLTEPGRGSPVTFWMPGAWSPEEYWHRIPSLWIGAWLGWFAVAVLTTSRRVSAAARRIPSLEPFATAALRPFLRVALGNVLAAGGVFALIGLLGLDEGLSWMLLLFGGISLILTAAAGLLPLLGVRDRLRLAKETEIAWCDAEIVCERERLRGGYRGPGRLTDLLTYRRLVEQTADWGFEESSRWRLVLYLLIPLMSWIASGVVQEVVTQTLAGR
jgi:hypothetical protein